MTVVCGSTADEDEWRRRDARGGNHGDVESSLCDVDTPDWLRQRLRQRDVDARRTSANFDSLHARRCQHTTRYNIPLHSYDKTIHNLYALMERKIEKFRETVTIYCEIFNVKDRMSSSKFYIKIQLESAFTSVKLFCLNQT